MEAVVQEQVRALQVSVENGWPEPVQVGESAAAVFDHAVERPDGPVRRASVVLYTA